MLLLISTVVTIAQSDSVPTLILERTGACGKSIQRKIDPNKSFSVWAHGTKHHSTGVHLVDTNALLCETDTILLSDISKFRVRDPKHVLQVCAGCFVSLIGAGGIFLGAIGTMMPIDGSNNSQYARGRRRNNLWGSSLISTGSGILYTGIYMIASRRNFRTDNRWTVKAAYHYYKRHKKWIKRKS